MSNTILLSVQIADLEAKAAALPRARESRALLLEQLADYDEVIRQGEAADRKLAYLCSAWEGTEETTCPPVPGQTEQAADTRTDQEARAASPQAEQNRREGQPAARAEAPLDDVPQSDPAGHDETRVELSNEPSRPENPSNWRERVSAELVRRPWQTAAELKVALDCLNNSVSSVLSTGVVRGDFVSDGGAPQRYALKNAPLPAADAQPETLACNQEAKREPENPRQDEKPLPESASGPAQITRKVSEAEASAPHVKPALPSERECIRAALQGAASVNAGPVSAKFLGGRTRLGGQRAEEVLHQMFADGQVRREGTGWVGA